MILKDSQEQPERKNGNHPRDFRMIESRDEMIKMDEKRLRKRVRSSLSKGVSLRATLSKIEQQETTSTEISVSHRTPSLISRVTSHELMGLTSRSDPKNTCRCSQ